MHLIITTVRYPIQLSKTELEVRNGGSCHIHHFCTLTTLLWAKFVLRSVRFRPMAGMQ